MTGNNESDLELVKGSKHFLSVFANHIKMCQVLEDAEADTITNQNIDEIRKELASLHSQCRTIITLLSEQPASTSTGIIAKCQVIKKYFTELPTQEPSFDKLLHSLVIDIERKVSTDHSQN